jgi:hypothetical protein
MQVGSLVEMVNNYTAEEKYYANMIGVVMPVVGPVYTVREIVDDDGETCLLLEEIVNPDRFPAFPQLDDLGEPCWEIEKFRELQPPQAIDVEALMEESIYEPA